MIIAIVKASIVTGMQEQLRKVAEILQFQFAPHEQGCEQYESFIDGDTFLTIERWSSQEALDRHLNAAHVAKYVPLLRECVTGGSFQVQFIESDKVKFAQV
jgi:quinol monooxygenase YgiN